MILSEHTWSTLVMLHAIAATYSLIFGAVNIRRQQKGDRPHKIIGYSWVICMYFVSISSFWIRHINHGGFSWIHILSIITITSLTLGLYAAIKGNIEAHKRHMTGAYYGLLGALAGVLAFPSRLIPQLIVQDTIRFVLITAAISISGYLFVKATLLLAVKPSVAKTPR